MIFLFFCAGVLLGSVIGIVLMCLLQIKGTHRLQEEDEKR